MTANPLRNGRVQSAHTSPMRAREWAALARSKGLNQIAAAWDRADREGWDDRYYQPPA